MEYNQANQEVKHPSDIANNDTVDSKNIAKKGYQGNITSKEAGNMVRDMIREQEKALMEKYR